MFRLTGYTEKNSPWGLSEHGDFYTLWEARKAMLKMLQSITNLRIYRCLRITNKNGRTVDRVVFESSSTDY